MRTKKIYRPVYKVAAQLKKISAVTTRKRTLSPRLAVRAKREWKVEGRRRRLGRPQFPASSGLRKRRMIKRRRRSWRKNVSWRSRRRSERVL